MSISFEMVMTCLFIFFARICDVTFMSIRTILLTKGMAKLAAFLGFFEVIIYIAVLSKVVNALDNPTYLLSYAAGYAAGNYIGSKIEAFLAFGDAQMRIILPQSNDNIVCDLRDKGFGVTVFRGEGRDGERIMLLINLKRKKIGEVYNYLSENKIDAFVSTNDITSCLGGYNMASQKKHFVKKLRH